MQRWIILTAVAVLLLSTADSTLAQTTPVSSNGAPSLDLLQERVLEYWRNLSSRNRLGAAEFILDPSQRERFISGEEPPFRNPRIETMDLVDYPESVMVMVRVTILGTGPVYEWPVHGRWVARDGGWHLDLGERDSRDIFSETPRIGNESELLAESVERGFRPLVDSIIIPDDAFGEIIPGRIDYEYDGTDPVRLEVVSVPAGLAIEYGDLRAISPGGGSIRYSVIGDLLFDSNLPDLVLRFSMEGFSTDITIPVEWNGMPDYRWRYVPTPVEAGYEGDIVLEIDNLTQETWRPGIAEFQNPSMEMIEFPEEPVGPGDTARYRFTTSRPYESGSPLLVNLSPRILNLPSP